MNEATAGTLRPYEWGHSTYPLVLVSDVVDERADVRVPDGPQHAPFSVVAKNNDFQGGVSGQWKPIESSA
jgi:hypothetical protein